MKGLFGAGKAARQHQDDADFDELGGLNGAAAADGNPGGHAGDGLGSQGQQQQADDAVIHHAALHPHQLVGHGHQEAQDQRRNQAEHRLPGSGIGIEDVVEQGQIRALVGIEGSDGDAVHAKEGQPVGDDQQRYIQMGPGAPILRGQHARHLPPTEFAFE